MIFNDFEAARNRDALKVYGLAIDAPKCRNIDYQSRRTPIDSARSSAHRAHSMNVPARIAVLVPCYNEEAAIGKVVHDFRAALPAADDLRLRQQFQGR